MDWKLEVVVVPVADVDRAKRFYSEQVGFVVDVDHRAGEKFRVVQMTPPGSACSTRSSSSAIPTETVGRSSKSPPASDGTAPRAVPVLLCGSPVGVARLPAATKSNGRGQRS